MPKAEIFIRGAAFELAADGPLDVIHTMLNVVRIHCSHGSLGQVNAIGTLAAGAQVLDDNRDSLAAV